MTKIRAPQVEEERAFRAHAAHQLMRASDSEIDTYINANVTSLQEARTYLKQLTRMMRDTMRYVAKRR